MEGRGKGNDKQCRGGEDNFHGYLLGLGSQLQYKGLPLLIYIRSQAKNTNTNIAKVYFFGEKKTWEMEYKFPTYFEWNADSHPKFFMYVEMS